MTTLAVSFEAIPAGLIAMTTHCSAKANLCHSHRAAGALHREFAMAGVTAERKSLWDQVLERRAQLALSLRVTTAALSGFALSHLISVPLPLWTVLTAVLLTQVTFGRSVKATIDYLAGTLGGAIYAGAAAALIPHANDLALAGVLALIVAPLALIGAIYPNFGAATFTGVLVLLVPTISHVGPIESAVDRVIEVALGGVAALAVSLLVLPARAHRIALDAAARLLTRMSQSIPEVFAGFTRPRDDAAIWRIQDDIGQALAQTWAVAAEAKHERIGFLGAEPDQRPMLRTLLRLRNDLVMVGRAAAEPLPATLQRLAAPLAGIASTTADHLRGSGEALTARREPSPIAPAELALDGFAEALAHARRDGLMLDLPVDAVERIFTLGFALEHLRQDLRDLDRSVTEAASER
jgi:uncharacterized membrane protein YccC